MSDVQFTMYADGYFHSDVDVYLSISLIFYFVCFMLYAHALHVSLVMWFGLDLV